MAAVPPLQPTRVRVLPPNVLLSIFKQLPLATLATCARVSRRCKVLVYDDEIWDTKLQGMFVHDNAGVLASLLADREKGVLIDQADEFFINNKPLNELIPGLQTDPFRVRARAKSTGIARDQFKRLYMLLNPYYIDLRNRHSKESMILNDYGAKPIECGKILNLLVGLGTAHVVHDWQEINEGVQALCQYFENASLHEFEVAYDHQKTEDMMTYAHALVALNGGSLCVQTFIQKHQIFYDNPYSAEDNFSDPQNLQPFKTFVSAVNQEIKQQSHLIHQVFPPQADVFYQFGDRVFEDVIAEYLTQLFAMARDKGAKAYLQTVAMALTSMTELLDTMTDSSLPSHLDQERGTNLLFKLILPFLDDYLYEEETYVNNTCDKGIEEWNHKRGQRHADEAQRMTNQNRETFKRDYLRAFKKVLTVPVDLVSTAATTIASPFQRSSALKTNDTAAPNSPSSPRSSTQIPPTSSATSLSSVASVPSTPDDSKRDPNDILESAQVQLDMIQDYLSLELALHLIHVNKDAERRVQRFIQVGFPGRMRQDIQRAYEQIFMRLLKALGTDHIKPAFDLASDQLLKYRPSLDNNETIDNVPPLTEFFELVHVADVIQQMVQLYYDEDMTKHIDRNDFMNDVNKDKKVFERLLDDCVARGMDCSIQVLLAQVELLLRREQKSSDYNPQGDHVDLHPTKACSDVIQCLKTNTSMLQGAAEKTTMDLFFNEIGRRFFEVLSKHLKGQTVNQQGGFRYICDMNAYYDFIVTLRQKTVTPYFMALKSLANIYIIDNPHDIKTVIHDMSRYQGLLRIEDLFEFAACRSDWPVIRKIVQKDMTDCTIM
ncbi:exocyst complex component Sec10-like protein [Gongronella butleri]|nr:exocyst complex component Sec10-like protein [Gongronella butleri]